MARENVRGEYVVCDRAVRLYVDERCAGGRDEASYGVVRGVESYVGVVLVAELYHHIAPCVPCPLAGSVQVVGIGEVVLSDGLLAVVKRVERRGAVRVIVVLVLPAENPRQRLRCPSTAVW